MPVLNYSTSIDADKTAAEVGRILAKAKVASTSTHYSDTGTPVGVSFQLNTPHGTRDFRLPINVDGVYELIRKDYGIPTRLRNRDQAVRVAWRIAKDWVEAQLALVQAGMVSIDEVMLPYLVDHSTGLTLYNTFRENEQRALTAGTPDEVVVGELED